MSMWITHFFFVFERKKITRFSSSTRFSNLIIYTSQDCNFKNLKNVYAKNFVAVCHNYDLFFISYSLFVLDRPQGDATYIIYT